MYGMGREVKVGELLHKPLVLLITALTWMLRESGVVKLVMAELRQHSV
jgi:hypothetical protein